MDRYKNYRNQIVSNLLLSKFVYKKKKDVAKIKRTIFSLLPNTKESEMAILVFAVLFTRRASFIRTRDWRGKTYKITQLLLTSRASNIFIDINTLTNRIIPYQLEHKESKLKVSDNNEVSWIFRNCQTPTDFNFLIYQYILQNDTFDISINVQFSKVSPSESTFLLRLFQLPVTNQKN